MKIIPHPSPNFGERRGHSAPDLVVLHYTAMETAQAALDRLCDPQFEVSAHYLIAEDGQVYCMVDEAKRAWHAGAGSWGGVNDVNSISIGIELANPGAAPFAAPLMDTLEVLLADIFGRHQIPPERVIAHSDCAPGRKNDPGPRFDWCRLAHSGLSIWPRASDISPDPKQFLKFLSAFGYSADVPFETLLEAFRLRFNPSVTGALSSRDMGLAADLAARYAIDPICMTS